MSDCHAVSVGLATRLPGAMTSRERCRQLRLMQTHAVSLSPQAPSNLHVLRPEVEQAVDVRPGCRLLSLRCHEPAQSSLAALDMLPLGHRGAVRRTERVATAVLDEVFGSPALAISLALRRCVFPVSAWALSGAAQGESPRQRVSHSGFVWVAGLWGHGPQGPAGLVLLDSALPAFRLDRDTRIGIAGTRASHRAAKRLPTPLMLETRDLAWWLDAHLVDRRELASRLPHG